VRLLLDTHVLAWLVQTPTQLSTRVRDLIVDAENAVFVSAATAWEIATKARLGKFDACIRGLGFEPLAVSATHAVSGARLVGDHRDPFDRLLAGQAIMEGLTLVTRDAKLPSLGVLTVW
jgi:PIN domain nuclease of toxin-antitoxin system